MAAYVTKWCVFKYKPVLLLQRRSLVGAKQRLSCSPREQRLMIFL